MPARKRKPIRQRNSSRESLLAQLDDAQLRAQINEDNIETTIGQIRDAEKEIKEIEKQIVRWEKEISKFTYDQAKAENQIQAIKKELAKA